MLAWEEIFVCLLVLAALISFVWERIPTDMTAILVFGVLMAASFLPFAERLPEMKELLHVFSTHTKQWIIINRLESITAACM